MPTEEKKNREDFNICKSEKPGFQKFNLFYLI